MQTLKLYIKICPRFSETGFLSGICRARGSSTFSFSQNTTKYGLLNVGELKKGVGGGGRFGKFDSLMIRCKAVCQRLTFLLRKKGKGLLLI